jgi:probable selenium-dependent hydroxylase accessory protein YqeC
VFSVIGDWNLFGAWNLVIGICCMLMDPNQRVVYSIIEKSVKGTMKKGKGPQSLVESLGLRAREVVSLVGAGGKTTLLFRLAKELLLAGEKVVTTTTTKILEPSSEETPCLFVHSDEEELKQLALQHIDQFRHVTLARERLESRKLKGVSPDLVDLLCKSPEIDMMIIEADGAAGRPAKAPREWEPVIPSHTTLVIGLLGVDGVGKELNEENFFQAEGISQLTGIPMGGKMTCEGVAILMVHPQGIFKGAPHLSRKVAFINKVDVPGGMIWGREIGGEILKKESLQIERVVLGQLKSEPPVAEVMFPSNERR